MSLIYLLFGAAFGALQFFLLSLVTNAILIKKQKKAFIPSVICIKIALYTACAALLYFFFMDYIIWLGIGFGVGMIIFSVIYFLKNK